MIYPDFINGCFEGLSGFFVLLNCYWALKDKQVKGISVNSIVFFTF